MSKEPEISPTRRRIARIALGDLIHKAALRFGDKTAIIDDRGTISFNELNARSNQFAHFLIRNGSTKGDHIGMLCGNSAEMVYSFTGIQKAGLVWVPINTGLAPAGIDQILEHAEIKTLVIDADLYARPDLRVLIDARKLDCIVLGQTDSPGEARQFDAAISGLPGTLPEVDIDGNDLALIMYTSGTTGRQKGVMHSHASVHAAVMSNLSELEVRSSDVVSCIFPMFHVSQHTSCLTFWTGGGAARIGRGFNVDGFMDDIERHRVSVVIALPMMYGAMLEYPRRKEIDMSSLRLCIYAMAPMSQTMLTRLIENICPNFALCSGQTEMYSVTTMFKPEEQLRRFGPYWGSSTYVNETAIMDDDGRLLEREQVGEIVHRGPNVMLGYYKDPEATSAAFAFGWHHTGDLGMFDKDGQLLFVDRKKDMIKSGGENVPSLKVEEALLRHAAVGNVAVVGLPHARWTEAVTAIVVLKPGAAATVDELNAHCETVLGRFERPKKIVLVDALPMTSTGKIQKAMLRAEFSEAYAQQ